MDTTTRSIPQAGQSDRTDTAEEVPPDPDVQPPASGGAGSTDDGPPPSRPPDGGDPPPEVEGARLPRNDIGNGKRLALYYGEDLLHVPRVGWHIWDGGRWSKDEDEIAVRRKAQGVSERIKTEVRHLAYEAWERDLVAREPTILERMQAIEETSPKERSAEMAGEYAELKATRDSIARVKSGFADRRKAHRSYSLASASRSWNVKSSFWKRKPTESCRRRAG